jgi:hypothetical protein
MLSKRWGKLWNLPLSYPLDGSLCWKYLRLPEIDLWSNDSVSVTYLTTISGSQPIYTEYWSGKVWEEAVLAWKDWDQPRETCRNSQQVANTSASQKRLRPGVTSVVALSVANTIRRGRAVAQAVSRWLLTAAARLRVRAACGVCGGQSGTGVGFLRVLRFPLPIIPPISPLS